MKQEDLKGLVILFKEDKELTQTRRIRIYQREKLADRAYFLIPKTYNDFDLTDDWTVTLQYIQVDGTVMAEILKRNPEDYEDKDGNATHMVYQLDINTKITAQAGDIQAKLSLTHTDFEAQTDDPSVDPEPIVRVIESGETTITILALRDYYSAASDASLSVIDQKILELDQKAQEIEAIAEQLVETSIDDITLDTENQSLYLSEKGNKVGEGILLNDLGDALAEFTEEGLINVVTGDGNNTGNTSNTNNPIDPNNP